jgi:hypothetical protein
VALGHASAHLSLEVRRQARDTVDQSAWTVPRAAELVPVIGRWSAGKEPEAWLFAAPGGGPLRESNWKRSAGWRAAKVAADVPDVCVHDLHHTAASLWLAAGVDPKVVQRMLGHATAAMTMDLYGYLLDASLWQIARAHRGHHGASEPPQERIRTESELGTDAITLRSWAFVAERPWGIESQAYPPFPDWQIWVVNAPWTTRSGAPGLGAMRGLSSTSVPPSSYANTSNSCRDRYTRPSGRLVPAAYAVDPAPGRSCKG